MPYLSNEQITELELQIGDLLEQLKEANELIEAQRLALCRANADPSMSV